MCSRSHHLSHTALLLYAPELSATFSRVSVVASQNSSLILLRGDEDGYKVVVHDGVSEIGAVADWSASGGARCVSTDLRTGGVAETPLRGQKPSLLPLWSRSGMDLLKSAMMFDTENGRYVVINRGTEPAREIVVSRYPTSPGVFQDRLWFLQSNTTRTRPQFVSSSVTPAVTESNFQVNELNIVEPVMFWINRNSSFMAFCLDNTWVRRAFSFLSVLNAPSARVLQPSWPASFSHHKRGPDGRKHSGT